MGFRHCSILAKDAGEPLDGTAPEKDSAIFLPAQKFVWHRVSAKEMLQKIPNNTELVQFISAFERPLVGYYSSDKPSEDDIIVANSSGVTCFSGSGLKTDREIKRLYAVCTDGKKDPCCSKFGIPISKAMSDACEEDSFSVSIETSHIGGCRFAATAICFPSGNSYGRILPEQVLMIKKSEETGVIVPEIFRGNVYVSEIHCWIMRHSMDKFGLVPTPAQTKIVEDGAVFRITIAPDKTYELRFNLVRQANEFDLFSGCSNLETKRSITRFSYEFSES